MPSPLNVPITPPRVSFIDERTGNVSREWYMFFLSLFQLTGGSNVSLGDVQKGPPPVTVDDLTHNIDKIKDRLEPSQDGLLAQIAELEKQVQDIQAQLSGCCDSSEIQKEIDGFHMEPARGVAQPVDDFTIQPQPELGTMSSVQQDNVRFLGFSLDPSPAVAYDPGVMAWGSIDQTLHLGHPGSVVQQVGQNMYLFAVNNTGSTISKGTAVGFAGVNGLKRIEIAPYLADGSTNSLLFIGVTAQDFPDGGTGKVTVFGRVENIDTSAFSLGDLLWADPINAGGLTATKPTAPDNVISVAAVLEDDASTGQIFVRPTIEQQKFYGEFTKTTDQTPAAINTAYALTFDNTEISNGVVIGVTTSQIIVPESGLYQFDVTIQTTSGNSSDKDVWVWFRKNGTNVSNTARLVTTNVNGGYIPVTLIAADNTAITIDNVASTAFAPAAPAVTLEVTQIQQ